jgi:FtsZ-interacting cell division protein ZipA
MKKGLKVILCIIGGIALVILLFWLCMSYTVNYKRQFII